MTEPYTAPAPEAAFELAKRAQADAADPRRSAWVEANAGSGKTKVLIDRVARLLLRREDGQPGSAPDSILCITYTKAAANEMLDRLFSQLGSWSVADDERLRSELSRLEGRAAESYGHDDLSAARALFARALETPGGLRIETIHAFCARLLRRFPLEAGVAPGFGEIEEDEAGRLWTTALRRRLAEAAEDHGEALLKVSRAGGGLGAQAAISQLRKRRRDIAPFLDATGQDFAAMKARLETFTGASGRTPEEIIEAGMGEELPRAALEDIAACLEDDPKATEKTDRPLAEALRMVTGAAPVETRFDALLGIFQTGSGTWRKSNPFTKGMGTAYPIIADLLSITGDAGREFLRVQALKRELDAAIAVDLTLALLQVGLPILDDYADAKRARASLDFDDLIDRTKTLLTRAHTAPWVLYKLDGGLTHVLLDEAQDTSPSQWDLINAIVEEFRAGLGREHQSDPRTLFVVGDKKQSIYSFQGADPERFIAEKQRFQGGEQALTGDANLPEMTMSFRSSPEVLDFVDAVFNSDEIAGDPFSGVPPAEADAIHHQPHRSEQPGLVELWPIHPHPPESEDESPWDAPFDYVAESSPTAQLARDIARRIRQMVDRGEPVWKPGPDGKRAPAPVTPGDILILVRRRRALFNALIDAMKREGLPVAGADRLVLGDHIGVQDCLNLIRFALMPGDDLTLAEILRGPFCGLVDDDNALFPLAHGRAPGETLWDRLRDSETAGFAQARAFCAQLLSLKHLPAFDFLTRLLTERGEDGFSGWDRLAQRLGEPVRDPVNALLARALGHDMAEPASLQHFLAETETDTSEIKRDLAAPDGQIRVMTVHGAKGLQAPVVILPDTTGQTRTDTDKLFVLNSGEPLFISNKSDDLPATEALREKRKLAEERESRRLLYVALTRAEDRLIIGGAFTGRRVGDGYDKSSWYALCRAGMQALNGTEAEDPVILDGVLRHGEARPALGKAAEPDTATVAAEPAWLRQIAPKSGSSRRLSAPSSLLRDTAPVRAPFSQARSSALKRGALIHDLLQRLPTLPEADRRAHGERFLTRADGLDATERAEILDVTLSTLSHPDFAEIFVPDGRAEAAIVGTSPRLPAGTMINGRVDRLLIGPEEILVIDYKTDRPAPASAREISPAYLVQMAAYRAVLLEAWGDGRPVRCALLYTDGPVLHELPADLLEESLNSLESPL